MFTAAGSARVRTCLNRRTRLAGERHSSLRMFNTPNVSRSQFRGALVVLRIADESLPITRVVNIRTLSGSRSWIVRNDRWECGRVLVNDRGFGGLGAEQPAAVVVENTDAGVPPGDDCGSLATSDRSWVVRCRIGDGGDGP